ncbi:S41 family peptidase [Terrimonas rubra]|uniref:S41 family peptidase n=1 Tax=Terrimonas rubra TaxID=1035890 RepID=A0ABW6A963_9BACT
MKTLLSFCILFYYSITTIIAQNTREIENQKSFAKVYGYLKYFYPGDEAAKLDWDKFAVYGAAKVAGCTNSQQLKDTLTALLGPLMPGAKIVPAHTRINWNKKAFTPPDLKGYEVVAWQHLGVGTLKDERMPYKSERTSRLRLTDKNLFDTKPAVGEYIEKPIGNDLKIFVPIALYGNKTSTYPAADTIAGKSYLAIINNLSRDSLKADKLFARCGNIINTWNVFQHFFPYFTEAKTDWYADLDMALRETYRNHTQADFLNTLRRLTAKLKDGHISVSQVVNTDNYMPPLAWKWIENKLVVTHVFDSTLSIQKGDIVTRVNGASTSHYLDSIYQYISAATPGWLHYRAETESLAGRKGSQLQITYESPNAPARSLTLERKLIRAVYDKKFPLPDTVKQLPGNIMYINIGVAEMDVINKALPQLQKAKAIICDLRGYPTDNTDFIQYLMTDKAAESNWMQVPQIIYPDQEKKITYHYENWPLVPAQPHLTAKIYFLVDGQVISKGESYMSYIEHYKLATIIGQPTAGTNGNVNYLVLPGGTVIMFTNMKVYKHDGSRHHGVGILPNIYVEQTIKGIREGRDEYLEKALEEANK